MPEQSALIDVSVPIRTGMISYEGDPQVRIERVQTIAGGGICNVTRMDFGLHSGTHIDAPVHFIEGAAGVEETPLDALLGPAFVVDATAVEGDLDAAVIRNLEIPRDTTRVIFKTPNSKLWQRAGFSPDFAGITEDGASLLIERGVRLAGIDYLSIAPRQDPAPTHIALLAAGVVILEGLDLREAIPGAYDLICLPLLIPGSDGAPARALLRQPPALGSQASR